MRRGMHIAMLALIAAVIGVQQVTLYTHTSYHLTQLTMSAYYSLVVIGLCLLMGYAGQISIGHAGFFAIGGYLSAFLTTHDLSPLKGSSIVSFLSKAGLLWGRETLYGGQLLTVQPWAACIAAVLFTVVIAYIIGGPVLKLKGHYLAMATLGFGTIVYRIALGTTALGAADGLSDVPPFTLLPFLKVSGDASMRVQNYYIAWGLVILAVLLSLNLIHSHHVELKVIPWLCVGKHIPP